MTVRLFTALLVVLWLVPAGEVRAANDNFRLSNMVEPDWDINSDDQQAYLYKTFSRELGLVISHKYGFPADTTGLYGFDIAIEVHNAYVNTDRPCPEEASYACYDYADPGSGGESNRHLWDPWRVFDEDHRLSGGKLYPVPGFRVRKGLPLSLEVGSALYFLPFSSQAALQGFGRWAIHEGFDDGKLRIIPDMALTVSGTRLVGNPEMDLGVLDWGMTFGWTGVVGGVPGSRVGQFDFFGGFGRSLITSVPDEALPSELQCLNGWTGREAKAREWDQYDTAGCSGRAVVYDPALAPWKGSFGFRVHNGYYQMALSMELARNAPPSLSFRTGLQF